MQDYQIVQLQSLNKTTARTSTFEVKVGDTVKLGTLYIRPQACREPPPTEKPESASFLQIWELSPENKSQWVFSGWMFASSPGLSSMDHAVFDLWVRDCRTTEQMQEAHASDEQMKPKTQAEQADEPVVRLSDPNQDKRFEAYEQNTGPTIRLE